MARKRTVKSTPKRGKLSRVEVRRSVEAVMYGRTEKEHYVVANPDGGWDVVRGNALRALKHFDTKKDAVAYGRQVSRNQKTDFVVCHKNGNIQRTNNH
ncbi:MAG: DUF2188 domain-containing protein [Candidatus Poribacteria bacterium]|nr:DUF2188 domain-containing protein [Candidatus Poribacteria bacterium]